VLLVASWGCGGSGESKSTPTIPPPPKPKAVRVVIVTSPAKTGLPRSAAGDYAVRVEDAAGAGVPGVRVDFKALSGPTGFLFTPADTVTTDSAGIARVAVTFRTFAGTDQLLASTAGVIEPALVNVTVIPGPPAFVMFTPGAVRLFGAGDSATFQLRVTDSYLNVLTNVVPDLQVSDSTVISLSAPATPGATGTVRALRGGASAFVSAPIAAGQPFGLGVEVFAYPRDVCAGVATPQDPVAGLITVADSVACLAPLADGGEYALIVYNESTDGGTSLGTTVTGYNVLQQTIPVLSRGGMRPSFARMPTLARRSASAPKLDLRFHQRLMEQSRSLSRLFGPARTARSFARAGSVGRIRGPSYSRSGSAVPMVGDTVSLNVSDTSCTGAIIRGFRVVAVGSKSIVLADTLNPVGGFTDADYARFAARFDTLVYPLDVGAFDAPSDIDGNGHVAILFTKYVNELTPANSPYFVGGFFHPRDLFPRTQSPSFGVCPTSNEGEMFYMMVPDPTGVVHRNQFRLGFVDTLTTSILAHEFQHLINAGRRMYVNTGATSFEETWLDEGLSHEAEELLFFHESGFAPRSQLEGNSILDTWPHFSAWVSDDASNFVNFYLYLSDPANHSPIDVGDALETRGATWAFLRFAVDESFASDAGVWQRFANSTTTGIGTLSFALQKDPKPLLRDFAVANMGNRHPSWNFGSVFTEVFVGASWNPIPFGRVKEGIAVPVAAKGGSAGYYAFAVPPGVQTLLRFGSSAAPPNGNLRFMLLRTNLGLSGPANW